MKAISVNPESVLEIFQSDYLIPNFQRPYSWEEDECEKFWEDILNFYDNNPHSSSSDNYFFGNIVVYPSSESPKTREVVDGQQRLLTLSLLIKALFNVNATWKTLDECLRIRNPQSGAVTDELRVKTHVSVEDMGAFKAIILNKTTGDEKNKFAVNYKFFVQYIDEWKKDKSPEAFEAFISMILNRIVLLPIKCESMDNALTIFETINNRGKNLENSDILKAKLYDNSRDRKSFMNKWRKIENHEWILRVYMNILRARNNNTKSEIALRKFFDTEGASLIKNSDECMSELIKIHSIKIFFEHFNGDSEIIILLKIMDTYPNQNWIFPLYVFLHKYTALDSDNEIKINDKKIGMFKTLLRKSVTFFFLKGIIGQRSQQTKDSVYKICSKIEHGKDFRDEYKISSEDKIKFNAQLDENKLGRYNRGIILIVTYLNPLQDMTELANLLSKKYDIEHILPKNWNNYDGWDKDSHDKHVNLLGNTMPLDRRLNIKASNEYFAKKKEEYKKSGVQDALDLIDIPKWTKDSLRERNNRKIKLLKDFFETQEV